MLHFTAILLIFIYTTKLITVSNGNVIAEKLLDNNVL